MDPTTPSCASMFANIPAIVHVMCIDLNNILVVGNVFFLPPYPLQIKLIEHLQCLKFPAMENIKINHRIQVIVIPTRYL